MATQKQACARFGTEYRPEGRGVEADMQNGCQMSSNHKADLATNHVIGILISKSLTRTLLTDNSRDL